MEEDTKPSQRSGAFSAQLPIVDVPSTYVAWSIFAGDHLRVREKSIETTLRYVDILSEPLGSVEALSIHSEQKQTQRSANRITSGGGLDKGAAPVKVRLPLEGVPYHFEKLLALDEPLSVDFEFKLDKS